MHSKKILNKGFTLLEMVIVIGIITLLIFMGTSLINYAKKYARDTKRKIDMEQLHSALEFYKKEKKDYPDSLDELVLNNNIEEIPQDPLKSENHPYYYFKNSTENETNFILGSNLETGDNQDKCGPCGSSGCDYCYNSYGLILTPVPETGSSSIPTATVTVPPDVDFNCSSNPNPATAGENVALSLNTNWSIPIPQNIGWKVVGLNPLYPNPLMCDPITGANYTFNTNCAKAGTARIEVYYDNFDNPIISNFCLLEVVNSQTK